MKVLIGLLLCAMLVSTAFAVNITGTVMYDGDAPARPALTATKDQHCIDAVAGTKSEALVVSKGKGIKNVVIYARVRGAEVTVPDKNPVMDQNGCAYYPHVLAIVAGSTVDLTSSDPVAHNVHSHAKKNDAINYQIPQPGKIIPHKVAKAEQIKFTCDIHAWMTGYIVAVDSNHFVVTGDKDADGAWISSNDYEKSADTGSYSIADVPAGKVRVVAWHEELGSANKTIEVPASGDIAVSFTSADFKKRAKK
jgi:plastocyanin